MVDDSHTETKHTFCRICEVCCGLELTLDRERIVKIKPNDQHIATEGFACAKGVKQHLIYDSPDRLQTPLKRVDNGFQAISWDQANREIGAKVRQLKKVSPHSIGMYIGTAAGFSILHPIFADAFMQGLGSRNTFSSASQDCAHRFASSQEMYGFPFLQPFPDLHNINYLMVIGTNPVVSKWTFLQVAHPAKTLRAISQRGGRVVVVDPRRTETAKLADQHIFIDPNADVFFLMSFLCEIIHCGGVKHDIIGQHTTGYAAMEDLVCSWPAERTAAATGIDPATLRSLVADYLQADGAGIATGTGIGMGRFGSTAQWMVECINLVTGNLDRQGGMLIGQGIYDMAAYAQRTGRFNRQATSRIGGFRELNGGLPGAILADEILTPGAEQIRGLFVTGGNPLLTMANSQRLKTALQELELLVVTDIFLNETASLAHYVLPATSPLERPDLPFIFPLLLGMQSRPYLAATAAVVKPSGQQRDEATIYAELGRHCGINLFNRASAQFTLNRMLDFNRYWPGSRRRSLPLKMILNQILRRAGQPGFRTLVGQPMGHALPPVTGNTFLSKRVTTSDGKVHLSTEHLLSEAAKLEAAFGAWHHGGDARPRFRLITKRLHYTHNSWTQNIQPLTSGPTRHTNHAWLHPSDGRRLGVDEGDPVDIQSAVATIRLPVRFSADLSPGVVAVPHGWGHQDARGLRVAARLAGANVNLLAQDGPDAVERLSGMVHLTGIEVDIFPSDGPIDTGSWSGGPPSGGATEGQQQ